MTRRLGSYAWASPNTAIGLMLAAAVLLLGGQARRVAGVLEVGGGLVGTWLGPARIALPWRAITLGHVILGIDAPALEASRAHEHVHVRQYEQWGPLFLPAYAASSLWQLACGRRCYRDNWFERQAYDRS
ncbi:MAG: signal peptide prediction [Gammaproteobacteria bacterium]|nr:signal peptide prediction [Gammaproteobacteria bacterium]